MIEKQSSTLKFLTMVLLCFERTRFEIDSESTVISVNKMLHVGVNGGCLLSSTITQESQGSSSVVKDTHSNIDSSMDNHLTTSNGNNRPEKHPLSMHEEVCNNEKLKSTL